MTDQRFDELMRDAEKTYRIPPQPDFEAMWTHVASQLETGASRDNTELRTIAATRNARRATQYRIAAALIVGIGLGRASMLIGRSQSHAVAPTTVAVAAPTTRADSGMSRPYELETSQYLGQTAALLIALPGEVRAGRADRQFTSRAADLLTRTRLLMDSPAANEPAMRNLLEDLELVLAQVVRLQNNGNRIELDLINRALEQRDVIPRLRTAVADISAN